MFLVLCCRQHYRSENHPLIWSRSSTSAHLWVLEQLQGMISLIARDTLGNLSSPLLSYLQEKKNCQLLPVHFLLRHQLRFNGIHSLFKHFIFASPPSSFEIGWLDFPQAIIQLAKKKNQLFLHSGFCFNDAMSFGVKATFLKSLYKLRQFSFSSIERQFSLVNFFCRSWIKYSTSPRSLASSSSSFELSSRQVYQNMRITLRVLGQ